MSKPKVPTNNLEKRRKAIAKMVRRNNRERKGPKRAPKSAGQKWAPTPGEHRAPFPLPQELESQPSVPTPDARMLRLEFCRFDAFHELVEYPSYGIAVFYQVEGEPTYRVSSTRLCVGHAGQVIDALRSLANQLADHVPDRRYYAGSPR